VGECNRYDFVGKMGRGVPGPGEYELKSGLDLDEHPEFRKSTFGVAQKLKHIDTNKVPGPGA